MKIKRVKTAKQVIKVVVGALVVTTLSVSMLAGCVKKDETLTILGYDDQSGGFVVRPYNELVTAFKIHNKVKVNFEIISSEEMSHENFLLKATSDLNVGKVDLVLGYGSTLAQLSKTKADLSGVYERHPKVMKAFQYDFMVPIDSLFYVDAYDANYLSKNKRSDWNHKKEQAAIIEELSSKDTTMSLPMYREYIKTKMYEKLLVFENGKYEINQPVFDEIKDEMKSLREVSGDIDETAFFSDSGGDKESYIGTPKVRFINGLNLKRILGDTAQFDGVLEKPSENKYPDVFGIYVRKNTELTDAFVDYMLSEPAISIRLDWGAHAKGRVSAMTDAELKEKATYLSLDKTYIEGYKAIQDYLEATEPLTREEVMAFDMRYEIRKRIFLACLDEERLSEYEDQLGKELESMSAKMKMVR